LGRAHKRVAFVHVANRQLEPALDGRAPGDGDVEQLLRLLLHDLDETSAFLAA